VRGRMTTGFGHVAKVYPNQYIFFYEAHSIPG
jgi:hypothetical protein